MRKSGLVFILLVFVNLSFGQYHYDFNPQCKDAYTAILNLKFDQGKKLIDNEMKVNPDNNIPYLLNN